jgi:hypothetical protein
MSDAPLALAPQPTMSVAGNRLGISHFLLWLAATAVVLTAFRPVLSDSVFPRQGSAGERFSSHEHFVAFVAIATIAPIWGAALAGFGLAGWRRLRGGAPFPVHPGHWLLLVVGSGVVAVLPVPEMARLGGSLSGGRTGVLSLAPSVALAALIVATRKLRTNSPWHPLFLSLAVSCGVMLMGFLWDAARFHSRQENEFVLALLGFAWCMIFVFALAIRSIADLCLERKYDALHWVGVALLPAHLLWLVVWISIGGNAA